jgi:hypothetical protein
MTAIPLLLRSLTRSEGEAAIHDPVHTAFSTSRHGGQSVRHLLRRFVAYGSANKYRLVNRSKASGSSAKRPTQTVGFFCPRRRS